ncbi:SRPBCC family protein [Halostella sp. PRR32]|uniref:SRPBCC family protein n=1 Tax=Halostella sp. PRR32 TaxID=3098147 RepID=UPI00110E7E8D|nr:SRPBCC family protein [Halostella sp. PRR32]
MAVYQRETRVGAPLSEVWDFHSNVSGLQALTPDFLNLRVDSVTGPDGEFDPDVLEVGAAISLSMQPFGVGPRQSWTSVIVEREYGDGTAVFRDTMEDGPFDRWVHTHRFFADGGETIVSDNVEYRLPGGSLGNAASPVAIVGFEPMFRFRHRKTKEQFEG